MELVKLFLQVTSEFGVAMMMFAGAVYLLVRQMRANKREDRAADSSSNLQVTVNGQAVNLVNEMTKQFTIQNTRIAEQDAANATLRTEMLTLFTSSQMQIQKLNNEAEKARLKATAMATILLKVKTAQSELVDAGLLDEPLAQIHTNIFRDDL